MIPGNMKGDDKFKDAETQHYEMVREFNALLRDTTVSHQATFLPFSTSFYVPFPSKDPKGILLYATDCATLCEFVCFLLMVNP